MACLGVGLPALTLLTEWLGIRRNDPALQLLAPRWARAMGVLFAVGAVSGTILSFEMGLLWPGLMGPSQSSRSLVSKASSSSSVCGTVSLLGSVSAVTGTAVASRKRRAALCGATSGYPGAREIRVAAESAAARPRPSSSSVEAAAPGATTP
ncbi:cytochrome ubiquinol oxidase subunit I [Streptomyces flaveolus]|uniref:cytochrome ubiquinol oxidase subunit I n=1 Tax=Streptomyces flaveolus TaxID=67297 RepID=UPI003436D597